MRIYFAGPLFTQAERLWNQRLADALARSGHEIFLPQEQIHTLTVFDAREVFRLDIDGVRSADVVVAILDGADPDSGTCFECGLAYALGIPIVAVRTDFRAGGDALPGQRLATINLMLSEAATAVVYIGDTSQELDAVGTAVLDLLTELPAPPPSLRRAAGQ
jgi:nucleoside 2-deoxyribosyltransferase